MWLEPLREEAVTKVGASGGIGAPCSGTVDGLDETGGKREVEPLWSEATMTAPADVVGCESELSRSDSVEKGFLREPD